MGGVDGCFHLAAIASLERCRDDRIESHDINVAGTIAVLDAARRAMPRPVRVVFASSASVYGDTPELPLRETIAPRPISAYGADKLAGEAYAGVAARLYGVPSVGLRLFNVFGPRRDPDGAAASVAAIFCRRIAEAQPVTIFGDGRQTRDFVHVEDAVGAFLSAMDAPAVEHALVNICTGRSTSVLELAEATAALCGVPLRVEHRAAEAGHVRASVGDPTRARSLLGFAARIELRSGLAAMLRAERHANPETGVAPRRQAIGRRARP
jgi:UDP-glucose 4-epimerase